jgi:hypothetical protein
MGGEIRESGSSPIVDARLIGNSIARQIFDIRGLIHRASIEPKPSPLDLSDKSLLSFESTLMINFEGIPEQFYPSRLMPALLSLSLKMGAINKVEVPYPTVKDNSLTEITTLVMTIDQAKEALLKCVNVLQLNRFTDDFQYLFNTQFTEKSPGSKIAKVSPVVSDVKHSLLYKATNPE